jgi:hypothetical protein
VSGSCRFTAAEELTLLDHFASGLTRDHMDLRNRRAFLVEFLKSAASDVGKTPGDAGAAELGNAPFEVRGGGGGGGDDDDDGVQGAGVLFGVRSLRDRACVCAGGVWARACGRACMRECVRVRAYVCVCVWRW